jgi:pyridoxal 5'-phosphate synthase pdxS subunit
MLPDELMSEAKRMGAPYEIVCWVAKNGKLPVPNFAAGGVATPADAALCMMLGAETVFVGSGIFKSANPPVFARAIVKAVAHWNDPQKLLEAFDDIEDEAMHGLERKSIPAAEMLSTRGW